MKLLAVLMCLILSLTCHAAPFQINASESLSHHLGRQQVTQVMNAIYAPLNVKPTLHFLPSERGLNMVNLGELDAEAGRVSFVTAPFKNLLQVPETLATVKLAVYCLEPQSCELSQDKGAITMIGGLLSKWYCTKHQLDCNAVNNNHSAFAALTKNKGSVLLATDLFSLGSVCNTKIRKVYVKLLDAPAFHVFHYIHKKHKSMLSELTRSIIEQKQNGVLRQFTASFTQAFDKCNGQLIVI